MPLTQLNQYQLGTQLGAGAMGEVYRARDTRLHREVAIKILPKTFAADELRRKRFEQEARTLAALTHPNILVIHDSGVHEGVPYLVSELLTGKTLRQWVKEGSLPLRKTIDLATQIAQGLAAAHQEGVIHRDLKPENIFISGDHRVKILDFGLAKLKPQSGPPPPSDPPLSTDTLSQTEPGVVLGTPGYMAPEQVRGEAVDHRTDIFAFGAVLYEMLSGRRAFSGESAVQVMNAVLISDPPDLSEHAPNVPPALSRVVQRCLEKQPDNRFQSAKDLAFALANASSTSSTHGLPALPSRSWPKLVRALPWVLAIGGLAFGLLMFLRQDLEPRNTAPPVLRKLSIQLPPAPGKEGKEAASDLNALVISPDGKKLLYQTGGGLWLQWLDRFGPPMLLAVPPKLFSSFWSPNSDEVAWFEENQLMRMPVTGGQPTVICNLPKETPAVGGHRGAWLEDGRIIFATGWSGLYGVSAQGGVPKIVVALEKGDTDFHDAWPLPKGRGVLFVVHREDTQVSSVAVWDGTPGRKIVFEMPHAGVSSPIYSTSGHVIFQTEMGNGSFWAFPFSLKTLQRTGDAFRIADKGAQATIANDGTLVLHPGNDELFGPRQLVCIDRTGQIRAAIGSPHKGMFGPRLSVDEQWVALQAGESSSEWKTSILDRTRGNLLPLVNNEVSGWHMPAWFPDGKSLLFTRPAGQGLRFYSKTVRDAPAEAELAAVAESWEIQHLSPSGRYLFLSSATATNPLVYLSLPAQSNVPFPFPEGFVEVAKRRFTHPNLSPDDQLLAYFSDRSGRGEVYVVAFPSFANRVQISRDGGSRPQWRRDGRELFYLNDRALMSVSVTGPGTNQFSEPKKLFEVPDSIFLGWAEFLNPFDVSGDGSTFFMTQRVTEQREATAQLTVLLIQNWWEEFRGR